MKPQSWKSIEAVVTPFPRKPFDFEVLCEAFPPDYGLASSCGIVTVTWEPDSTQQVSPDELAAQVAHILCGAGIEAAEILGRTVWTVMNIPTKND